MGKNKNSPHEWDNLLGNSDYLADYGMGTSNRINYAKKWIYECSNLLNIGSGQGYFEKQFVDEIRDGRINWTSLDISPVGLNEIHNKLPRVNCVKGNILNLPFSEKSFDVVVCMEVLEHLDKKVVKNAYREMLRVGRKKALYVISVPVYEPTPLANHPVGHYRKFTPSIIEKELLNNGFTINDSKLVYAFNSLYFLKSLTSRYFNIRRPSVAMFLCQKS